MPTVDQAAFTADFQDSDASSGLEVWLLKGPAFSGVPVCDSHGLDDVDAHR